MKSCDGNEQEPDPFGVLDRTVGLRPTFLLLCVVCPISSYTDEKADLASTRSHCAPAGVPPSPLLRCLTERYCICHFHVPESCAVMRLRRKTFSTSVSLYQETTSASVHQPREISYCFAIIKRLIMCGCWKGLHSELLAALLKLFESLIQSLSSYFFC